MLIIYFVITFLLSLLLTPLIRFVMRYFGIIDEPKRERRKIHKHKTPLGGGLAIFLTLGLVLWGAFWVRGDIGADISWHSLVGIFLGGFILMIGGLLDDKYNLRPIQQIWFPILASLIALASGIGLESITNPSGGVWSLNQVKISVQGLGNLVLVADMIVFFWLMAMMFTTKLLDGMDGLATGIVTIGAFMIFFLSREDRWFQPEVALVSLVFAASCLGFLVWNFHRAKIFLGEGGSLFLGYVLGILAIISGSKVATTLLVMGFPMLDVIRVVIMRLRKKRSPFVGDNEHLHFRLLSLGLTQTQTVLFFYSLSFLFGMTTLFLQSHEKLIALSFLFLLMLLLGIWFSRKEYKTHV